MIREQRHVFMHKALMQAKVALRKNEVPVGAIVVDADGNILAKAYNQIEHKGCHSAHAEILAIQKACKKKGDWRLDGCWLYVTLEPCLMCFGLIQLSRIKGLAFAASSDFFGSGLGSFRKDTSIKRYNKDLIIESGLKEEESIGILRQFFRAIRKKRKGNSEAEGSSTRESEK